MIYNEENQNIIHDKDLKNSLIDSIREEDNDIKSEAEEDVENMLKTMSSRLDNTAVDKTIINDNYEDDIKPKVEEINNKVSSSDMSPEELVKRIENTKNIKEEIVSKETKVSEDKEENTKTESFFSDEEINFSNDDEDNDTDNDDEIVIEDNRTDEDSSKYYYHSYAQEQSSKTKGRAFLDKISVDLNNIEIGSTKKAIDQNSDLQLIFNSAKATFSVVCCQSGYRASMLGLTLSEKNALTNSTADLFESREKLYRIVYAKIDSMSIPKPNYNEWLRMTSFSDLETLLFGIYCQTFIDNNDFDVTCGNCGKTTSVTVDNNSLIEVRNREIYGPKFNEIAENANTIEKINQISVLNKSERIMLDESKLIVDVTTPSLHDHLSLLKKAKPEVIEKFSDSFSALMFISHMYVLDTSETYKTGIPKYYEITEKSTMLSILNKLSVNDGDQLTDSIERKLSDYRINYEIHNVECSNCHQKIKGIPLSIERILFMRLDRTRTKA